jgi:hypothetical protein
MSHPCLQLPGSLTATKHTLSAVGDSLNAKVFLEVVETSRDAATDVGTYVYYISTIADMNALISYTAANVNAGLDDAYAFSGYSVTDDAAGIFFLPTASAVSVQAGLIDASNGAYDKSAAPGGTFPVWLTLGVDRYGVLSGSISIHGLSGTNGDLTCGVVDNNMLAQVAYWDISGVSLPSVDKNAADILTATLSAAQLTYNFQSRLDTIMGFYQDVELIDSWTVALSAVASATNNTLAQHARSIGNLGNSTVFASGDKVMAMTPFPYQIDITNNSGQVINIVPSTSIYGVVVQL